jgi:hypothetical protein
MAKPAQSLKFRSLWRLYACDALLKRLAQDLEDVTPELRECIEEEQPWCASDTSPGIDTCPPPIRPTSDMG